MKDIKNTAKLLIFKLLFQMKIWRGYYVIKKTSKLQVSGNEKEVGILY